MAMHIHGSSRRVCLEASPGIYMPPLADLLTSPRLVKPVRIAGQLAHLVRRRASSEALEGGHFPNFCTVSGYCLRGGTPAPVVCNVFATCLQIVRRAYMPGAISGCKGWIRHTAAWHTPSLSLLPDRRTHCVHGIDRPRLPEAHRQALSGGDATGQGRRHRHCAAPRDSASGLQAGRRRCAVVRSRRASVNVSNPQVKMHTGFRFAVHGTQ